MHYSSLYNFFAAIFKLSSSSMCIKWLPICNCQINFSNYEKKQLCKNLFKSSRYIRS